MISKLEKALEEKDARGIEVAAHTIKGAVSNFHVDAIRDLAAEIERHGRENDFDPVTEKTQKLAQQMVKMEQELISLKTSGLAS